MFYAAKLINNGETAMIFFVLFVSDCIKSALLPSPGRGKGVGFILPPLFRWWPPSA